MEKIACTCHDPVVFGHAHCPLGTVKTSRIRLVYRPHQPHIADRYHLSEVNGQLLLQELIREREQDGEIR